MSNPSLGKPLVDIMNDPAYAPRRSSGEGGNDVDHCRICRSEGTAEEQLFHPCKCSGSIKFVHQECLMEWLQHSQKKYCELCKTPFQFTKLYDPKMPKNLPPLLFLSKASKHVCQTILLWLRFVLVCFVWLGVLPWVVRWMWRFWFWLGDGSWAWWRRRQHLILAPLQDNSTLTQNASHIITEKDTLGPLESNIDELGSGGLFTNLTQSPVLNKIVLDTLEGQILTALIVVTFVMIFLIREWVVQQQPDLAFVEVPGGIGNIAELEQPPEEPPAGEAQENERQDEESPNAQMLDSAYGRVQTVYPEEQQSDEDQTQSQPILAPRPIAPLRRRRAYPRTEESQEAHRVVGAESAFGGQGQVLGASSTAPSSFQFDSNPRRPQVNREVMAQAAELRRQIEEQFGPNYLENFARSPAATFQGVAPLKRNDILDDDSDWEDEEDESTDNKYKAPQRSGKNKASPSPITLRPLKNPSIASGSVIEKHAELEDRANSSFSAWPRRPDYHPPKVIFGANHGESKGADLFGDWDKSESAFAKPFQFTGADAQKKPLLESRLFPVTPNSIQRSDEELEVGSSPQPSVIDKGKGKAMDPQMEAGTNKITISGLMGVDNTLSRTNGKGYDLSDAMSIAEMDFKPTLLDQELAESSTGHGQWGLDDYSYDNNSDKFVHESDDIVTQTSLPTEPEAEIVATSVPDPENIDAVQPVAVAQAAPPQILARPAGAGAGGIGWIDWLLGDIPRADARNAGREMPDEDDEAVAGPNPAPNVEGNVGGWNGAAVQPEDVPEAQDNVGDGADGAAAPVDIDEGDDFDGIMELVGMRGSIFGLLQNAAISLVLITAAVMLGVAIPYIWGRIILTILAHPILFTVIIPWSLAVFCANLLIDTVLGVSCYGIFAACISTRFLLNLAWSDIPAMGSTITNLMHSYANDAWRRVAGKLTTLALILASDRTSLENVSLVTVHSETSHAWLASRQPWARATLAMSWLSEKIAASANLTYSASHNLQMATQENKTAPEVLYTMFEDLIGIWKEPSVKQQNTTYMFPVVSEAEEALVEFSNSSSWTAADRVMAVIAGYVLFTIVGAWYLSKHKSQPGSYRRQLEKTSIELLQQAGGVMKVILIIGIEMFVFPLYCGLLLDIALLPLFENATILSRIQFTIDHIFTSTFVHWFVGTCYMFHFALFVSMCRKIMRAGVLYFIRDPDDPTLHPVKDVLERPVMLQLRKIAFSALIYGFLVLVCLGGVVWFLYHQFEDLLPIHWSSNEPVLEFPVDLLFYNFFMPVAVQFFKPSEGLQKMYSWWFKKCARALRLTSFMFGDRHDDEEGQAVRRTWHAKLLFKAGDLSRPVRTEDERCAVEATEQDTYFLRDGRFVRAPASDSVRRAKGQPVFIPVTEDNKRLDGLPDPEDGETGPNSTNFKLVYIPPHFKLRIFLMVLSIWLFAAVTGVGVTVGPLLLGRTLLRTLVPRNLRMNDIYAFSIGIYIVGALVYTITKYHRIVHWVNRARTSWKYPGETQHAIRNSFLRAIKISYVFVAFALVLPTLLALIIEFYIIIPMHTYFSQGETHVIHFIQDWTLGVLYVKMMGSMMLLDPESPWARALRGVVARGYLDPDVKLATRCFILPATLLMTTALLLPLAFAYAATKTFLQGASPSIISQTYRYSYPAVFILLILLGVGYLLKVMIDRWKQSVRDEVYLIGERLHNHGEKRLAARPDPIGTGAEELVGSEVRRRGIGDAPEGVQA